MRLLAAFLLVLALAPVAAASESHPTLGELEGEVICPTCHTTLDQSSSPIAARMKLFIAARIRAGDTKSEIERKLVAQFGPEVIAKPSRHGFDLVAWLLPLDLALLGAHIGLPSSALAAALSRRFIHASCSLRRVARSASDIFSQTAT